MKMMSNTSSTSINGVTLIVGVGVETRITNLDKVPSSQLMMGAHGLGVVWFDTEEEG